MHNSEHKLKLELFALRGPRKISSEDKKAIREFHEVLELQNISIGSRAKYVSHLTLTAKRINKQTHSMKVSRELQRETLTNSGDDSSQRSDPAHSAIISTV